MQRCKYRGESFRETYALPMSVFIDRWTSIAMAAEGEARETAQKRAERE
jgi:hypothetical protein